MKRVSFEVQEPQVVEIELADTTHETTESSEIEFKSEHSATVFCVYVYVTLFIEYLFAALCLRTQLFDNQVFDEIVSNPFVLMAFLVVYSVNLIAFNNCVGDNLRRMSFSTIIYTYISLANIFLLKSCQIWIHREIVDYFLQLLIIYLIIIVILLILLRKP